MSGSATRSLFVAEPPTAFILRTPLVVDCSTLAALLFREHWVVEAEQNIANRLLHAPYLLQAEIANVAIKKSRQGMGQIVQDGIAQLEALAIELHRVQEAEVIALADRYRLSAYDACYLWLAAELKAPLATFDERLATAAKSHLAGLT